jgi:hypothetical protein
MYFSLNKIRMIKSRKIRRLRDVACNVLVGKPEGKRQVGRLRRE